MQQIQTGKGTIPLISLLSIWSISLIVDLPGLAISPLLSNLDKIFPNTSELEIQLLSTLPNFFIFPFILLSGKLSVSKSKVLLVVAGLIIFLVSGISYFFADNMILLIIISCVLGIGCGLVIPLAAGLLAEYFTGPYRAKQLGIKSGIANFSLIIATLIVGWSGKNDWHLPFIVYLLPVVPLLLSPFLTKKHLTIKESEPEKAKASATDTQDSSTSISEQTMKVRIWSVIGLYFLVTFCAIVLSLFIPFLMQKYNMTEGETGVVNAIFYLFITLPGFLLGQVVGIFRHKTTQVSILLMLIGLLGIALLHNFWGYLLCAACIGFGYGTLQPLFYDKAARIAPSSGQSSLYLSFIMSANYLGIAVAPFIVDLVEMIFGTKSYTFPFLFNAGVTAVLLIFSLIRRNSFVFYTENDLYK